MLRFDRKNLKSDIVDSVMAILHRNATKSPMLSRFDITTPLSLRDVFALSIMLASSSLSLRSV